MGMLDGMLGGLMGAGLMPMITGIIEKNGGLQALVNQFERNGYGSTIQSWVSNGPNDPIAPADLSRALGPQLLQTVSQKTGLSEQLLTEKLAGLLPQVVDKMTPDGRVPAR